VLSGWDLHVPQALGLVNPNRTWTLIKSLSNGDKDAITIRTEAHKESVSFSRSGNISKVDFTLNGIRTIELDYQTKTISFKGKNGTYSVENGNKHKFVSNDGKIRMVLQ
jgi:hypothetical protein